ncbi:MAG TPA: hypothetical protein VMW56_02690 [Candidatus Margulisiibacteriota bacterium]|nr:hypothetical protein [Candidatus Margulisiibacteriota bacterium]
MTTLEDSALDHESIRRPGLGLLLLEGRAVLELAALQVTTCADRALHVAGGWRVVFATLAGRCSMAWPG